MSANMDLVTSHRGNAHITTQNVIDLIAGLSGDIVSSWRFLNLYDGLESVIESTTRVKIKRGGALAGGYFWILNEAYNWNLDPGAVGYSRIDMLYLVIYENYGSMVQSCDFVYQVGTSYPNGQQGEEPSAPTGANIIGAYRFLKAEMTDGALTIITPQMAYYPSNNNLRDMIWEQYNHFQPMMVDVYDAFCVKYRTTNSIYLFPHMGGGGNYAIAEYGYIPIGVIGFHSTNSHVNISAVNIIRVNENPGYSYFLSVSVTNETDEEITTTVKAQILFIRESLVPEGYWREDEADD